MEFNKDLILFIGFCILCFCASIGCIYSSEKCCQKISSLIYTNSKKTPKYISERFTDSSKISVRVEQPQIIIKN